MDRNNGRPRMQNGKTHGFNVPQTPTPVSRQERYVPPALREDALAQDRPIRPESS
ncbi:hypothetical protein LTR95_015822, partial [Oleoguttula sp. CCFEE 5521]